MLLYFGRQLAIICKGVFNIILKYTSIIEITNTRLPRIQIRKVCLTYFLSFDQYIYSKSILHLSEVYLSRFKQYKLNIMLKIIISFSQMLRIYFHFLKWVLVLLLFKWFFYVSSIWKTIFSTSALLI